MPNYEYHCSSCGHDAEVFQKIAEAPLRVCPSCGKETFDRLISQSSFALRGSGWYADGYGAKADKTTEKSSTKKAEPAEKPAETPAKTEKAEPKPAPKPSSSGES